MLRRALTSCLAKLPRHGQQFRQARYELAIKAWYADLTRTRPARLHRRGCRGRVAGGRGTSVEDGTARRPRPPRASWSAAISSPGSLRRSACERAAGLPPGDLLARAAAGALLDMSLRVVGHPDLPRAPPTCEALHARLDAELALSEHEHVVGAHGGWAACRDLDLLAAADDPDAVGGVQILDEQALVGHAQ